MGFSRITSRRIEEIVNKTKLEILGAGKIESDLENETKLRLKDAGEEIELSPPKKSNINKKKFLKYIDKELKKSDIYAEGIAYCVPDGDDHCYKVYGFFYKKRRNRFIKPDK